MGAAEKLQAFAERLAIQSASDLAQRDVDGRWDQLRCNRGDFLLMEAQAVYDLIADAVGDLVGLDVDTEDLAPAEQGSLHLVDAALEMLVLRLVDDEQRRANRAARKQRADADRVEP